jgi:hypothetical protein
MLGPNRTDRLASGVIPALTMPRIEAAGDCRKCGAPVELYTWTLNARATHAQHRCVAGHIYWVDTR